MSRPELLVMIALVGCTALAAGAAAAAPSQLDKRKEILDKVGLQRDATAPKKPDLEDRDAAESERGEDEDEGERGDPSSKATTPGAPAGAEGPGEAPPRPPAITYSGRIHALMTKQCASCHGGGGMAASTGFRLTGTSRSDYQATVAQVRRAAPTTSPLLREALGEGHGGGAIFSRGSASYRTILQWIEGGVLYREEAPAPAASGSPSPSGPAGVGAAPAASSSSSGSSSTSTRGPRPGAAEVEPSDRSAALVEPGGDAARGHHATSTSAAAAPTPTPYAPAVHALLRERCGACHRPEGMAKATRYVHRGDPEVDYAMVRALVRPDAPGESLLLRKGRGEAHAAGATIAASSDEHRAILAWIADGAHGPYAAPAPATTSPASDAPAPGAPASVDAVSGASPRSPADGVRLGDGTAFPEAQRPPSPLPFSLPFHLQVNGKIDLSYERRDYKDHPFGPGRNAFASYHHFVYLSRSGAKDPFGFNIELVTQQFYEVHARVKGPRGRLGVLFKAGKVLVPFGNEPLFHTSYGGRAGFDQEILPVVWARPGLGVHATVRLPRGVTLSDDLYLIAGHALPDPAAILNLQSDQSTLSEFKAGFGDRLGASVGPFTAWYSLYFNPLGFDRTLLMQAFDLELWRPSDIPLLRDLSLSLGVMRADVAGAGRGGDYYHFGSYWTLAYQPLRFLSIQYRNGLRTHDNRRGAFIDRTRLDANDRGSHNLSIYARYKGIYAGFQLFWNLERADEQDDDFMRVTVGYAF